MYKIRRTNKKIREQLNKLNSKASGDDYAGGALDMFDWLNGNNDKLEEKYFISINHLSSNESWIKKYFFKKDKAIWERAREENLDIDKLNLCDLLYTVADEVNEKEWRKIKKFNNILT